MFSLFPVEQILGGEQPSHSGARGECGRIFCAAGTFRQGRKTACVPFGAVTGGLAYQSGCDYDLVRIHFSWLYIAVVGHHFYDDSRADGEAFHECLPHGQIVHFGRAVREFLEDFLFFVVQPGEQVFLMPYHQRQQLGVCAANF